MIPLEFNAGLREKFPDDREKMKFRIAINYELAHLEPLTVRHREKIRECELRPKRNVEREIRKREAKERDRKKEFYLQIVPSTIREGAKGISQGVVEALKP